MATGTRTIPKEVTWRERAAPWLGSDLRCAFIVWGPPSLGPRSQVLARELGIQLLHFIYVDIRRGVWSAPFRYVFQAFETLRRLLRERPQVVFVQSPPSLAVLCVYLYCRVTGSRYLVDAHSAALLQRIWMWPRWLHRFLVRRAITTMVTNEHFQAQIQAEGGHAFVLPDIASHFDRLVDYPLPGTFRIAVVNTFAADEPLQAILTAARELPEIDFYITGNTRQAQAETLAHCPENAHFSGFLPNTSYYALLGAADAVMCLTTREHTMQRGACEALSLGKPIITSDTRLLRNYFDRGAIHVSSDGQSIREGILRLKADTARYRDEILDLQRERHREWQEKKQLLAGLVRQAVTGSLDNRPQSLYQ